MSGLLRHLDAAEAAALDMVRRDPAGCGLPGLLAAFVLEAHQAGLMEVERRHGLPARSGKAVVRMALRAVRGADAPPREGDVIDLREQLDYVTGADADGVVATMARLGVPAQLARTYLVLARGGTVSREGLWRALHGERPDADWPEPAGLHVAICKLRAKLPPGERIITVWGGGWRLEREAKRDAG